jgi:DNA primase
MGEEARERVRDATDIVQLIGERVALRRAGRSYKGLCPFHTEKTPSFTVTPDRQIWHCFGCSKGGDVFAFLMELDKLTFPEALRALADRAGIDLPKQDRGPGDEVFDKIYQANALARDFFMANLAMGAGAGPSGGTAHAGAARARAYLAARGFEEPWISRFEVGWAPEGWDGLLHALNKLLPAQVLEQAGLIVRRGDGSGHYDRFRNRVLFPVAAASGKIAGFGARAIVEGDEPKYLNSPETPVFRKGRLLYGLPVARPGMRESREAIVAEGYLDVMRLHACGFTNAVSTCGTALTVDQARLLARLQVKILLLYDGDDAGVRAADRALDSLLEAGLDVRLILLPGGEDPDSFLRGAGAGALRERMETALDVPAFLAGASTPGKADPGVEARVRRLVGLLGRVEDPIRRRFLLRRGADVFGLEETVLLEAVQGRGKGKRGARAGGLPAPAPSEGKEGAQAGEKSVTGSGAAAVPGASEALPVPSDPIERELAGRALTEEGAFREVIAQGGATCFRSQALQELLRPWIEEGRGPHDDELRALMSESSLARALIAELFPDPEKAIDASRREARELVYRLEERWLRQRKREVHEELIRAERSGDDPTRARLSAEWDDVNAKLSDLASKLETRRSQAA